MGEVISDSIQIEIESNSTNASKSLDALAGSLEKLKKNGSFKTVSTNLNNLEAKFCLFLPLTLGKKGGDVSEAERGGGSPCGGFKSARQYARDTIFVNGFAHALGYIVSKSRKGCRCSRADKFRKGSIKSYRAQNHSRYHVGNEYSRWRELGFVDQYLRDKAENTTRQK